jgi:hypothetical protein
MIRIQRKEVVPAVAPDYVRRVASDTGFKPVDSRVLIHTIFTALKLWPPSFMDSVSTSNDGSGGH